MFRLLHRPSALLLGFALVFCHALVTARASDCATAILELLETYRALAEGSGVRGDLISTLEDAVIMRPACAPALIAAAVGTLDGDDESVGLIVRSALEIAPEQAEEIIATALQASSHSDEAISSALLAEASSLPSTALIPTSGGDPAELAPPAPAIPWVGFPASGLTEIGSPEVVPEGLEDPVVFLFSMGAGFDSNVATAPASVDSGYGRIGLGARIHRVLENSSLEINADSTYLDYGRTTPALREENHLAGFGLRYQIGLGARWKVFEELRMRRDTNPDIQGTLTTALRQAAYHTLFNRLSASFDVTPLWQMRGGYTLSSIDSVGNTLAAIEERTAQAVGLETRHQLIGDLQVSGSYEAESVDFRNSGLDYTRHETLAGLRTSLGERLQAYLGAGAQFRRGGSGGSSATPAAETALIWTDGDATRLRWVTRYGQFDHELALLGFDQREGWQSILGTTHALTDLITLHASAGVLATGFEGATGSLHETAWTASLEATRPWYGDFDLSAGYHLVRLDSPIAARDYIRHQVDVGLTRMF